MLTDKLEIHPEWKEQLLKVWDDHLMLTIKQSIQKSKQEGNDVFPPGPLIFNSFNRTPFSAVKVVILGQDPYHRPGQAMGLSFSVPRDVRIPPSLKNIYKELIQDVGIDTPSHGDLTHWADQGVLLLNAILTVESGKAASHSKIGWADFTDRIIRLLSDECDGLIFLLWGNFAKSKKALIDCNKHHVLEAAHPSPLARNAFSGCAHFSKTNLLLTQQGKSPINWSIPDEY